MSQQVLEQFKKRAEDAAPLEGTLKFIVDGSAIYIDGTSGSNTVTLDDKEADCSITVTAQVLEQLRDGELNPMMATMSGKIKIVGDMGLAMKVQSLMG